MGLDVRKPVFCVFEKARLKPVSSATETSYKIEISLVASLHMILSKKRIINALTSLRRCAGWSVPLLFPNPRRQVFSHRGPNHNQMAGLNVVFIDFDKFEVALGKKKKTVAVSLFAFTAEQGCFEPKMAHVVKAFLTLISNSPLFNSFSLNHGK